MDKDYTTHCDWMRGAQVKGIEVRVYLYNEIMFSVAFTVCGILSDDHPVLVLQSC